MATDLRKELQYYIPAAQRQTDYVKALLLGQNPEYDDTEERRRLGLTTRDDNGWTDVKKAASWVADKAKQFGKNVYEGATDIDPLLQLGLVNHVFGNDSVLSMYNANKQAEQAREAQREYNEYLREYDRKKERADALKEAKIEAAQLNRDLVNAKPADKVVIAKRLEELSKKFPELNISSVEAQKANEAENAYQSEKVGYMSELPTAFATFNDQQKAIEDVMATNLRQEDKDKIIQELRSIKPLEQMKAESSGTAIAGHAGKKTGEALDEADLKKKAEAAIKNNTAPSSLTKEVLQKIRELGRTWKNEWVKSGAK